jgi:hypothetical protein
MTIERAELRNAIWTVQRRLRAPGPGDKLAGLDSRTRTRLIEALALITAPTNGLVVGALVDNLNGDD